MKSKTYKRQLQEYEEKYGHIPIDHDEILKYLEEELKLTEKDFQKIHEDECAAASIPWNSLNIVLPIIPKASPRPRYHVKTNSFYVTGAAENHKLIKYFIKDKYDIIYTQTRCDLDFYLPTPLSSMTKVEVYRAENKTIIPTSNPDWDNLIKTYTDMIQGILLLNDNIISGGTVNKFYSVKPRVDINIQYQLGYDSKFTKRRTESTKAFRTAIETGCIINVYTEGGDFI